MSAIELSGLPYPCCGGPHTAQPRNPYGHAVDCEHYGRSGPGVYVAPGVMNPNATGECRGDTECPATEHVEGCFVTAVPPRPAAPPPSGCGHLTSWPHYAEGVGCLHDHPAAPGATAGDGLMTDEWWTRLYLAATDAVDFVPIAAEPKYPAPHAAAFRSAIEPALRDVLAAAARDAETVRRAEAVRDFVGRRLTEALDGTT